MEKIITDYEDELEKMGSFLATETNTRRLYENMYKDVLAQNEKLVKEKENLTAEVSDLQITIHQVKSIITKKVSE